MNAPALHEDAAPLAFLLGTWRGEGKGEYPTIDAFDYLEEVRFWHVGKPFLIYTQRTWRPSDGRPLHAEMGYWRGRGNGEVELVLAHPTGVTEIEVGRVEGKRVSLESRSLGLTPTAVEVTALAREFEVTGDTLSYTLQLAAVGQPLQHHLAASLERVATAE